jgi:non-specific serine/threonine protein kinase
VPSFTWQALENFPYARHASPDVVQRGRAYYKNGSVIDVELSSDHTAICIVAGDSDEYEVIVKAEPKTGNLRFSCDCPFADEGNFCKHMVAAGLGLSSYLDENPDAWDEAIERPIRPKGPPQTSQTWWKKLDATLASMPRHSTLRYPARYVGLVIMDRSHQGMYRYYSGPQDISSYSLTPFVIKAPAWYDLTQGEIESPQAINEFLQTNKKWMRAGERWSQQVNPAGCLNLAPDAVAFMGILSNAMNLYGFGYSNVAMYLSMLSKLDIPVFIGSIRSGVVDRRVHILPKPVAVNIDLHTGPAKISLRAGYEYDGRFVTIQKPVETISHRPAWMLMDDRVGQLQDAQALAVLSSFPIEIPAQYGDRFRDQYFARIAQAFPIRGSTVAWHDVHADPVPRLYLRDGSGGTLQAELRFCYGQHEWPAAKSAEAYSIATVPDSWTLLRIHRRLDHEERYHQMFTDPAYGLKRAGTPYPYEAFQLRARVHPFDFLLHAIPLLTRAGFEVYGEEQLKLGKINRATPVLRVAITSGIDWFDLKTRVEFGDQEISFHDIRRALKRGERYIKLADGSVGQIPEDWLEKYKHLWNLSEETKDGFRVNDLHLSLIDSLLEDDPTIRTPPDLVQRRGRFRRFEQIAPQPLPQQFTGELRPYQKHGIDWLHFLRDYKFGGILADDMGLGKTVQVLAYLQSLKEQARGRTRAASLLVVPKSLIANWQLESKKFTANLGFLEYLGNSRSKDSAIFNNYDVILTTYGTMLRDIDSLRRYKFHYIILDESQAIKNPMAKGAKAVRLLDAEHRLVMTGTPVENNTIELWSQFAFLNPGLLGSADYFKREFAAPIESRGDETAAATLRKLVYPFILRRTKEQVAPELPPRTERVIYSDMDSAQRKFYSRTRERYRAELLGLIDSEGINDVRFKILEGLLRLRQIAIHPAMVDKKYKGEAAKFEILFETLETLKAENHKVLVFSQFVETLKLVRRELDTRKTNYVYLDGKTANRQSRVDLFQNDPAYPFFLISLKAGGVGLNLTAADYVIHLDPWWNPAVEMQAADRAHRIGQDKPVFVYKLIARDTVEEKIMQLQEKKRALVKSLIASEAGFFKSLTKDDVRMMFD